MTVIEVGLACGFENQGHFGRLYRGAYGVSPSQQRARLS
ncbi:helix-turn-helix domain-containing protein [Aliisedimentitalea sp. MJ-SS2]